ncbi:DMT family transporter [Sansalvadorimonas verongulae]|uniref:DMT family transporter n=1 Tax=Sansalvadorimonas verongulae TaxID=2172824 RepID=UPI002E2F4748|nr:DMT family transporter [Sansalvadorimonas verongulae]
MSHSQSSYHSPLKGAFWMLVSGLAFAIVNSATQWVSFRQGFASADVALYQYGIAMFVLLPWMFRQGFRRSLQTNHLIFHIVRVATAVIGVQFWLWAMAWPVPIWQAIALLMTSPLFVVIGSALFLQERVTPSRWLATAAGFFGAMVILEPWADSWHYSALLPLVAAVFWAAYSLMTKAQVKTESPTTLVFYLFALTVPFNLFISLPVLALPQSNMWPLLLLAGVLTGCAQLALTKAYQCAEAAYVQPFDLAKLPLNVLVGFLVMGTVPPGELWLGAALIIGATLFITHRENYQTQEESSQGKTAEA